MRDLDHFPSTATGVVFLALLLGSLLLVPPAAANVLPEAAFLVHVQPVPPEGEPCATTITNCNQIVHTTSAEGQLEFLVFFYPQAYVDDHYPIQHVSTTLTWPSTWQLVSWAPCGGGEGTLQLTGSTHPLDLTWPDCPPITGSLFLMARLVFDVSGPGKLDFQPIWVSPVWLGCPPDGFEAEAMGVYAAAGLECGYSHVACAWGEHCMPTFESEELALTAAAGSTADGWVLFQAYSPFGSADPCPLTITPHAPWAQATAVPIDYPRFLMHVVADAADLDEGVHETWIEVHYESSVSRCLKLVFTVTSPTASVEEPEDPTSGEIRRQTWGQIKNDYRRP